VTRCERSGPPPRTGDAENAQSPTPHAARRAGLPVRADSSSPDSALRLSRRPGSGRAPPVGNVCRAANGEIVPADFRFSWLNVRTAATVAVEEIAQQQSASPSSDAASTWICGNIPPRQTRTDSVSTVRPDSISDNRCGRTAAGRRSSTTCRPRRQPSATKTNVPPGSCRSPRSQQSRPATPSRRLWRRTVPWKLRRSSLRVASRS
jgi:hypothetical protein